MSRPQLLDAYGRPLKIERQAPTRRAGYDAAKTTKENEKHWAEADGLSPTAQLTPEVRDTLRNRARYEVQNNSYAAGLVRTLVGDTVGMGPRLQMQTGNAGLDKNIEDLWRLWTAATNMPLNFRVLAGVKYVTGECFAVFRDSKRLDRLGIPVTLDIRLVDPAQVTDPMGSFWTKATGDDGIECDEDGEIVAYKILKSHPGDTRAFAGMADAQRVPAENVLHWMQPEWPGQLRGAPPLAPALDLFAQLRRFTRATLTAAEVAAMLAGVLESDLGIDQEAAVTAEQYFDTIELVRGTLLTLPRGVKATQFEPNQPTTNYQMFVDAKLRECGRCLNVPFGKMAGDHSRYNYSSGRMDDAPYWHDREIERQELQAKVFDPVFYKFCDFARFAIPALVAYQGRFWDLKHTWHYDARPVSDPTKDAAGDELNLTNGTDSLAAIAARDGLTEDELLDARKATMDKFVDRGLPLPPWLAGAQASARQEQESAETPLTREEAANAA